METRIATQTGMETHIAMVAVYKAVRSATHSSNVLSTTKRVVAALLNDDNVLDMYISWYMVS